MFKTKLRNSHGLLALAAMLCLFLATPLASADNERQGLVLQINDDDPRLWHLALNIAAQAPTKVSHPLDVKIVAFGPGLNMLLMDSRVGHRIKKASASGVEFLACGMTMKKRKLKQEDLYPSDQVRRVDAGVVEIIRLQKAGWSYVKI